MDHPIHSGTLYTVNIETHDFIVPNDVTLPEDGFFAVYSVKDNIKNYYYVPEEDDWVHFVTSHGSVHTKLAFHAHRHQLLEQFPACYNISYMLDKVNIPIDARLPLISKIHEAIISIANDPCNAAPKIMPILVEITTWSCHDMSDWFYLSSDPDEDTDEEITADTSSSTVEENEPKAKPAARSAIESLEKVQFDVMDDQERVCTICFEDFLKGVEVISMPCKHVFHGECITKWLEKSNICPLCRFEMPVDPSE